jgi:RimJ/RimL family protein N-acetyltransferase
MAGTDRHCAATYRDLVVVRLRSGVEVLVRPIAPDDKGLLSAFLAGLSRESAYRRFLAPKLRLSEQELRELTEVDFRDHVAFVAVHAQEPGAAAGVARWVRSRTDPAAAEFAFVVTDALQRQGLGTALVTRLADSARELGIRRLTATALPHNLAARRLLAGVSERLDVTVEEGVFRLEGELAA